METQDIEFPRVPRDLLETLERAFPRPKLVPNSMTEQELWQAVGEHNVIERLRLHYDLQNRRD